MISWHEEHQPPREFWCKICKKTTLFRLNNFQMDIGRPPQQPYKPLTAIFKKDGIISVWECLDCEEQHVTLVEANRHDCK